jgi:hypothetical protein
LIDIACDPKDDIIEIAVEGVDHLIHKPRDVYAARSGERRIRTGRRRFVGWRSTSARAQNGRRS